MLTIALMQGGFVVTALEQTYLLITQNFDSAFPRVLTYAQWLALLHALGAVVGHLIQHVVGYPLLVYLMDSKPIPTCKPIRHGRVRLLREDGV